jgi:hypothetical protein
MRNEHRHSSVRQLQSKHRYIEDQSKSRQHQIPGLFVDTIIYQPITFTLDNLSRPPIWLKQSFSFFSFFEDRLSPVEIFSHNPNSNSSHNLARQHFTRNVSKLVYHDWLNQFYLSILLHLRVRVTALLGLATLWKRANFSSTVTSTCLWCLSSSRTLLPPPRFTPWTPHLTSTMIPPLCPTNFTISLTHT